ncbi:2-oxoglutarate ferredoxin oxidoreductase subunit alpha [bacterium M21]|nr:2-oxoglutarate ferredoxin oxidoreductase subunit alpha [bacterium M21]
MPTKKKATVAKKQTKGNTEEKKTVVIRFAGDSGDGMQTAGELFAECCAIAGNDINTFPDFPSEIRAPAGSLPGVSGFQVHIGSDHVFTPGDKADALFAMNPAALKVNLKEIATKGLLVVNTGSFTESGLAKAHYDENPLDDPALDEKYQLVKINVNELLLEALKDLDMRNADKQRCKNFFALGFMFWVYDKPLESTIEWIQSKWKKNPIVAEANITALTVGHDLGQTAEIEIPRYQVQHSTTENGIYRKITGNEAVALGLVAAGENSWREVVLGSYPITPATPILEHLAKLKNFGVKTVQAEDEIAGVCVAIGAAFAGSLAVTTTSGPGLCLKSEALGLAVITELPLVVVNVMRAGPSTGLPTKTEQGDLLQAFFGRNGESPMPIIAAATAGDCFDTAYEAARIALQFRTPVMLLTDTYLANGTEPWKVPKATDLPDISVEPIKPGEKYVPYKRNPKTLARQLAIPGRPGFEHRIGGLEKNEAGQVSYDAENHEKMVKLRAKKVERIANFIPPVEYMGEETGDVLVMSWGSTYGPARVAVEKLQAAQKAVTHCHLRYVNPLPRGVEELMRGFNHVVMPECNLGQMAVILRSKFLIDVRTLSKVQGRNFTITEIYNGIKKYL